MSDAEDIIDLGHFKRSSFSDAEDPTGKKPKITASHIENSEKRENLDVHVSGENAPIAIEKNGQNKSGSGERTTQEPRENNPMEDTSSCVLGALNQSITEVSIIEADAAEDKGSRHSMEDAWVVLPDANMEFPGPLRCAHFAIYDGHGGRLAAEYAQKHLHENVLSAGLPPVLGCKVDKLPILDLGLPLNFKNLKKSDWMPLVQRVQFKLASGKAKHLSLGGRITLLNLVLSRTPLHFMAVLLLPVHVCKKIDHVRCSFFWKGAKDNAEGIHLVYWNIVCQPVKKGGLGVLRLQLMNTTMVGKWLWQLLKEHNSLWRRIVYDKHYQLHDCFYLHTEHLSTFSPVWRVITSVSHWFQRGISVKVGNGHLIYFWENVWASNISLEDKFPDLFFIAVDSWHKVSQYYQIQGSSIFWSPLFHWYLKVPEIDSLAVLLQLLEPVDIRIDC